MSAASWLADFTVTGRKVQVKKTGAVVRIDRDVARGVLLWFGLYAAVRLKSALNQLGPRRPAIWFAPDRPRPWYLIWAAAAWSGIRIANSPDEAIASFYFEDATFAQPPRPWHSRASNYGCADVSKSRVAEVFEQVFGYPLSVDPTQGPGPCVEKGEANGAHDGRVVERPLKARPGRVYQRLVDNTDGVDAIDLRTPFVGGRPVLVFVKRRPVARRFANFNTSVSLKRPQDVFSRRETEQLSAFAHAMRLDWGGLDVLRDAATGRLYVVDVNKTDMPPLALPFIQKIAAVARLGRALRQLVEERQP